MPTTSSALLTMLALPALVLVGADRRTEPPLTPDPASTEPAPVQIRPPGTFAPSVTSTDAPADPSTQMAAPADDHSPTASAGVESQPATPLEEPEPVVAPAPPESSFVGPPTAEPLPELPAAECVDGDEERAVAAIFDGGQNVVGADYQRALPLPNGRVLWLFQDAFVPTAHGPELVHNVGLVQSGSCFQLLRTGSSGAPTSYLFADLTDRYDRWFWPLGGEIGVEGLLHVFVAEMVEHGAGYLQHTEPVANWRVTIDPESLDVVGRQPAPDSSASLYGWSVVSHDEHSYLYAHCYRQFGWDEMEFPGTTVRAHDFSCAADVTVARVPRGRFGDVPEYWNGEDWTPDPASAASIFPVHDRRANPVQVAVLDGRFVSVTKVDDWWGKTIHLDVADRPEGPWGTYGVIPVETRCSECNTYFASIVPFGDDTASFPVAISNNTWGGHDLDEYVPTVMRVPAPPDQPTEGGGSS